MINAIKTYVNAHESLILKLKSFSTALHEEVQAVDPYNELYIHEAVWDQQCFYMPFGDSEIVHYGEYEDFMEIEFSYSEPYDDSEIFFTFRFFNHWEHLSIGEIVKDIFDKSEALYQKDKRV